MTRALRIFFTFAVALSSLLAVVIAVMWLLAVVRPGKYIHKSQSFDGERVWIVGDAFILDHHSLWFLRQLTDYSPAEAAELTRDGALFEGWRYQPEFAGQNAGQHKVFAFRIPPSMNATLPTFGVIFAPLWMPLLAASVLPAIWIALRLFRRRRIAHGCCADCGYDLRGSPLRCPECGRAVG